MAEFHLHGQIIKRSQGRSAVNAAAYRAGETLYDKRLDRTFDYTGKHDVEESIILGPDHAPEWMFDREMLWNTVEDAERHKRAQLAREFDIAVPIDFVDEDPAAAKEALKGWVADMFVAQGLMVDINFHNMGGKNPHVHVMTTMRRVHSEAMEFQEESRYVFEDTKARDQNDWGYMDHWRETWADYANAAMADHGIDARIDHRTLIEQDIDREPGIHIGPVANAMEARGEATGRWLKNAMIWFDNEEPWFEENRRYVAFLDAEIEEERRLAEEAARRAEADRRANAEAMRIVLMADALADLSERLELAVMAAVTTATKSLKNASDGLDGGVAARLAAYVTAVAQSSDKLVTLSPGGSIEARKRRLAKVGERLDASVRHSVALDQYRLVDAQATLRGAALTQLSRLLDRAAGAAISVGRTRVEEADDRLARARPTFRAEFNQLRSTSARLDVAAVSSLKDQTRRLRTLERRLEATRPTRHAHVRRALLVSSQRLLDLSSAVVRAAIEAGRYARESVAYTLATIAGRGGESPGRERERIRALGPKENAVERQAILQSTVTNDRAHAEWLLFQLQALKTNLVRRERGEPRLDLSLIPDRLQEAASRSGTHPMIQEWLNEVDRAQASRLMTLLQGSEPVVRRGKDGLTVIRDRVPAALAEFADDKLQYDDVIRLYAEAALRRWQGAPLSQVASDRSQSSPSTGVEAASKSAAARKLPPRQHESPPPPPQNPYDQAAKDGWRRGGTGVGDD